MAKRRDPYETTEDMGWDTPGFTIPGARVESSPGVNSLGGEVGTPWMGTPGSPTNIINLQNPTAEPTRSFVQAGDTGGYQVGRGVTRRAGTSQTQAEFDAAMEAARASEWGGGLDEWLSRNPEDPHRFLEAMKDDGEHSDVGGGFKLTPGMFGRGQNGGSQSDLAKALQGLWGGGVNQDIINRRVSNASDTLNRFRKSQTATNQAALANRGLIGSGPEATAAESLETGISDRFANAINDIYADESQNADRRMLEALGLSTGLESNRESLDLQRELGLGRLGLDETLGLGGLALGNLNAVNSYNLGLGRLGLDRDLGMAGLENMDINRLIQLLEEWARQSDRDAAGFV